MIFIILNKLLELNLDKILIVISPNSSDMMIKLKELIKKTNYDFNKISFVCSEKL